MNYWLVKSEPSKYSWNKLVADGLTMWDGVRNYAARNNLRAMQKGDNVLFYHSNEGLAIMGIAKVVREHYPDPTTDEDRWLAIDIAPAKSLKRPVTLEEIKGIPGLRDMQLIRLSRLSVSAVTKAEFDLIVKMSEVK